MQVDTLKSESRPAAVDRPEAATVQPPALNALYAYLTEGCNLACRHCYLAPKYDPDGSKYQLLSVELFEHTLREAKPLGLKSVKLSGGEPMLHPDFPRFLALIEREGLRTNIESNGTCCSKSYAAMIASMRETHVSISLDGADAEVHESVRVIEGSFEQACTGIRNLVDAGVHPQIVFSVMQANRHQVGEIVHLAERLGVSSVKFNVVQPSGRGELLQRSTDGLSVSEYLDLAGFIHGELAGSTDLPLLFDVPIAFRPLSSIAGGMGRSSCGIKGILGILPSGDYALCGIGTQLSEMVFGRAGVDSLEKVWREHPTLLRIRKGLPARLSGVCGECLMKHRCLGACVAQNIYRSGSPWTAFWFCEQADELGLFPETRRAGPGRD